MPEKRQREVEQISETIRRLATPGMKPKALIEAVKEHHPEASKKEIARAALLTIILSADYAPEDGQALHDIAEKASDVDNDKAA